EARHPAERGDADRTEGEKQSRPGSRAAAADRTGDDLGCAERAGEAADTAADRLVPVVDREANGSDGRGPERERGHEPSPVAAEHSGEEHSEASTHYRLEQVGKRTLLKPDLARRLISL